MRRRAATRWLKLGGILAALSGLGRSACAQAPPPAAEVVEALPAGQADESWTLETLLALAAGNNPTLAQAAAAIDQARGNAWQVGLYPNPQVGYLRSDPSDATQSRTNGVYLGQEFVTAGKRWKSRAVEAQEVQRLLQEREAQQGRVFNDVAIRFMEALGAQRALWLYGDLVQTAEVGLATTEKLQAAGQASRADVLQARIQLKALRLASAEAQARFDMAWRQVASVVGLPRLPARPLAGQLDGEVPHLDWDEAYGRLLAASPVLRAAQTRIQHARSELQREQAQRIPNLSLQLVTEYDSTQQFTNVSTLVAMPLPVFNRNQGNIAHAAADIREAYAEVRRTRLALQDQLADVWRRYETARQQVVQLRADILPDVDENLRVTDAGYRAGEINFLQVLAARETFSRSQVAYVDAWTELRKAVIEIDGLLLTGGLNPASLGTALQAQGGLGGRPQGLLNQLQEGSSRQLLPPALQSGTGP